MDERRVPYIRDRNTNVFISSVRRTREKRKRKSMKRLPYELHTARERKTKTRERITILRADLSLEATIMNAAKDMTKYSQKFLLVVIYLEKEMLFKNIVLGSSYSDPSGILGSLCFLDQKYGIDSFESFLCTGTSSIIGLLLISGYKPLEVLNYINIFSDFTSIPKMKAPNVDVLMSTLTSLVTEKFTCVPTMENLYRCTGRVLRICVYDSDVSKRVVADHESCPDLSCVDLVLMSVSPPPFKYRDSTILDPYPKMTGAYSRYNTIGICSYPSTLNVKNNIYEWEIIVGQLSELIRRSSETNGYTNLILNLVEDSSHCFEIGFSETEKLVRTLKDQCS